MTRSGGRNASVLRLPRHDLDQVVAWVAGGGQITRREEITRHPFGQRADIILVNTEAPCGCRGCNGTVLKQYAVEVNRDGTLHADDPRVWQYLSPEDVAWAEAEAQRMLASAEECPPFATAYLR